MTELTKEDYEILLNIVDGISIKGSDAERIMALKSKLREAIKP